MKSNSKSDEREKIKNNRIREVTSPGVYAVTGTINGLHDPLKTVMSDWV